MDYRIFWTVLGIGVGLVVLQGLLAWLDGYFSQTQMRSMGIVGWSFLQHGGMWADVFLISPLIAVLASTYRFGYSWRGIVLAVVSIILVLFLIEAYRRGGTKTPEAHAHDGYTTAAGRVHALFATAAIWILAQAYFGLTTPAVSTPHLILICVLLTPFFYLGAVKFGRRWRDTVEMVQVWAGIAAVWSLAFVRILFG